MTYVTSLSRKDYSVNVTFSDAHIWSGFPLYGGEVITNMFFVMVFKNPEIRAFPFERHVMMRRA